MAKITARTVCCVVAATIVMGCTRTGMANDSATQPHDSNRLLERLGSADSNIRAAAATDLGQVRPVTGEAVLGLLRSLKDSDQRVVFASGMALDRLGSDAKAGLPEIIKTLKSDDAQMRTFAAFLLGRIGPPATEAAESLGVATRDPVDSVRVAAVEALSRIRERGQPVDAAVIAALKDNDKSVRYRAAESLSWLGADAKAAVPALAEALQDKNKDVSSQAASTLRYIGPDARVAIPALVEAMKGGSFQAALAIGSIGAPGDAAIKELIKAANDNRSGAQLGAIESLGQIGPVTPDVVPALVSVLKNRNVDKYGAMALGQIGPRASEAVDELGKALLAERSSLRESGARAIGQIGVASDPTKADLRRLLTDKVPAVRVQAAFALAVLGDPNEAFPVLLELLKSHSECQSAARTIADIGHAPDHVLKAMEAKTKDEDRFMRIVAAGSLLRLGRKDMGGPALEGYLRDPDRTSRAYAFQELGRAGPAAAEFIPQIRQALRDSDYGVRVNALIALRRLESQIVHQAASSPAK